MTLLLYAALWIAADHAAPHIKAAEAAWKEAEVTRSRGESKSAEAAYLRAIDIEPTYVEAFRGLIEVYRAAGRSTECAQMLTRLLQIEPNSAADRVALAALLMDRREWMRALAQYTAAVRIDPRNADALYGFARAAEESGMADRAAEAATLGQTKFPTDKRFGRLLETLRRPREEGSK